MRKQTYWGVFFVALATLMYEILLTRIFSVTMWFHFAFVAISIAMFGMTVGAIVIYLAPGRFPHERTLNRMALCSLGLAVTIVVSFVTDLYIPFKTNATLGSLFFIGCTYTVISVPFIFSGVTICLALTKFPNYVGRMYAADLAGAALGCVLIVGLLGLMDAPSAVFVTASFAAAGSVMLASHGVSKKILRTAAACGLFFLGFAVIHAALYTEHSSPLLGLRWIKGSVEARPFYRKWNSFSRITVSEDPNGNKPFGWGLSSEYKSQTSPDELMLKIDSGAATPITAFDGDLGKLEHLKYDVINVVHYLRPDSKVLVVGTGGGRDILSALVFDQRSIFGVELNKTIIDALNKKYGDFSGHLDRNPKVTFVNDEARSYITQSKDKFDIIQVSFIDTAAATAAGAFVFTENSLYTIEAWKIFLERLEPRGILTFSRWYYWDLSGEIYRLASLAREALERSGISNPRSHILIVKNITESKDLADVGTILVAKNPFTPQDLERIRSVCKRLNFEIVLEPDSSRDPNLEKIVSGENPKQFIRNFPINISAPTDDNPFYFSMLRLRDVLNKKLWDYKLVTFNVKAIFILGALLVIVSALTFCCVLIPLLLTNRKANLAGTAPLFVYFTAIGLGFMFIEISQMQRLNIFLGHPIYGLSVVLFTLLLSSSLGSYTVRWVNVFDLPSAGLKRLLCLVAVIALFGILTPNTVVFFDRFSMPVQIAVSAADLFPLGFFMGMAFPLGIKFASARFGALTPWLWGMNGVASVLASVLAAVIALNWGISASFWTGFLCYLVALLSFIKSAGAQRERARRS